MVTFRLRVISLVGTLALLASLLSPGSLAAQVPVEDPTTNRWWGMYLIERLGHAYILARNLRDESLNLAKQTIRQTRRVTSLRRKYEDRAVGELGRLGDFVPDWRDYANYCAVDVNGYTVCNINRKLMMRYERVLYNYFYAYRSELFREINKTQRQVEDLLGRTFGLGTDVGLVRLKGTPEEAYGQRSRFLIVQAEQSAALEQAARDLNLVLDSLTLREIQGQNISSGRAKQLTAFLAYIEALVDTEVVRAQLRLLDTKTIAAADKVRQIRRDEFVDWVTLQ